MLSPDPLAGFRGRGASSWQGAEGKVPKERRDREGTGRKERKSRERKGRVGDGNERGEREPGVYFAPLQKFLRALMVYMSRRYGTIACRPISCSKKLSLTGSQLSLPHGYESYERYNM